jgi:hypothetical protein
VIQGLARLQNRLALMRVFDVMIHLYFTLSGKEKILFRREGKYQNVYQRAAAATSWKNKNIYR